MAQQLDEPLDARIPEALVAPEPVVRSRKRPWVDAAVVDASADGAFQESSPLEHLDVLRRRSERHPVRRRELAHGLLALGEPLEHLAPGVGAERAEDAVEPGLAIFNHRVEYGRRPWIVNRLVEVCVDDAILAGETGTDPGHRRHLD